MLASGARRWDDGKRMSIAQADDDSQWLAVIGRALAFLCLSAADLRDKGFADQGALLEALGVPRRDAARMLGTSEESLRVMVTRARGGKEDRRAKKPKRK